MCGIAGFVSNQSWQRDAHLLPLEQIAGDLAVAAGAETDWALACDALDRLADGFDALQSFGLFAEVVRSPDTAQRLRSVAESLRVLSERATRRTAEEGADADLRALVEKLNDYVWQVQVEVLDFVGQVERVMPRPVSETGRPELFVAWSIARVLSAVDRLEVRGRDSLGVSIVLRLQAPVSVPVPLREEFERRCRADETVSGGMTVTDGDAVALRVVYKVANLVGSLGENTATIRSTLRDDVLLWRAAAEMQGLNIVAHTRWASNGIINESNCHPVDGIVESARGSGTEGSDRVLFTLNGDVDNYADLVDSFVAARGKRINPAVSTDAKILPVLYSLGTERDKPLLDRFIGVLRSTQGSLAVVAQDLERAQTLFLGQKGSGQALYAGETTDGWLVASETYGLAAVCRSGAAMNAGGENGAALQLSTGTTVDGGVTGRSLTGNESWSPSAEPIQIFSRDIDRGSYELYIDKEINESPKSVAGTLLGKYRVTETGVDWLINGFGRGEALLARVRQRDAPLRRIACVGQGTAAVAAMGIAYLLERVLHGANVSVDAKKASEFFGFIGDEGLEDTLVVAVSQSGTTADTNRIVDIARESGAWVHAIVNRRDSALVKKADSHLYTSSGRDVEMSVASTKAFYSQVVAGKLLALFLADEFRTISASQVRAEIVELETLPSKLEEVLRDAGTISDLSQELAVTARNWAVVGNGANRIAAEEIRIKLSELCYKAIPCDVTEDKKHIDLSTEPLTLVVANDLPEMVVQDTVKEVAIFRAHNGRPVVFCQRGETRFDGVANRVVALPPVGGGLHFVVATMAGHLFAIAAARGIDQAARPFREVRAKLSALVESVGVGPPSEIVDEVVRAIDSLQAGCGDSALSASLVAQLGHHARALVTDPSVLHRDAMFLTNLTAVNNRIIEELTRPIDAIRHQAKTVTVGISRPVGDLSSVLAECLLELGCSPEHVPDTDRHRLAVLSPVVTQVTGGLLYDVLEQMVPRNDEGVSWLLQAVVGYGESRPADSRYARPLVALGSKRAALRRNELVCRPADNNSVSGGQVVLPVCRGAGGEVTGLVLVHVRVPRDASLQQKTTLLRLFSHRYEDLRDRFDDTGLPPIDDVLTRVPLADLLFHGDTRITACAQRLVATETGADRTLRRRTGPGPEKKSPAV